MRAGLPGLFLHTTGISANVGESIPANAILFNGVPLLYNGEYITFTNV